MLNLLALLAASSLPASSGADSQATTGAGPIVAVRSIADLPNTTVRYYDVAGKDITGINRSIAAQRPSIGGRPNAASTDWTVNASFKRRTENGQCKVDAAEASFVATADLPRLIDEQGLERPVLERWRSYVAALEAAEIASLVFVYAQVDRVEKAILASSCESAKAAGMAAVEQLRSSAAAFELERRKQSRNGEQRFGDARIVDARAARAVCKDLLGTGSRLNTLRVCMKPREWAKLHESGQQATREMQDKPRVNRAF